MDLDTLSDLAQPQSRAPVKPTSSGDAPFVFDKYDGHFDKIMDAIAAQFGRDDDSPDDSSPSSFHDKRIDFLVENCEEFAEGDENSHRTYEIHKEYVALVESFLDSIVAPFLNKTYTMDRFLQHLEIRSDFDDYLADVLLEFADFRSFKEECLRYKTAKAEARVPPLNVSDAES